MMSDEYNSPQVLERKLTTILSADVAQYSRLMAEDEEHTLHTFRSHKQVFESLVALHRGRIFNTAGDALLAEFTSAVEAVRCATEIQSALRTRNDQLPPLRRVMFRIGINLGDVMVQGADLLGDGVNVAARLQSGAEPGGICISGSVYDQIRNKLSLSFKSHGEQRYKNIPQPVRCYSIREAEGHGALPVHPRLLPRRHLGKLAAAGLLVGCIFLTIAGAFVYSNYQPVRPPAIAAGKLTVAGSDELTFAGEQGGPFRPAAIALQLKATGGALHWSTVGAPPAWLSVAPDQADLPADGSAVVTTSLTSAAQSLAPGRYAVMVLLRNDSSGAIIASSVSVVVSPKVPVLSANQEQALKPKDTFKECTHCPQMIVLPAGRFTMGSPTEEPGRKADEGPQHDVAIASPFAVGTFGVTRDEFAAFVTDTGYETGSKCIIWLGPSGSEKEGFSWRNPGFGQTGSHPVVCVSWSDAQSYVNWLNKKTAKHYHLLSESEWEYAARAGSTTTYYWGDEIGKNNASCSGCGSQWDNNGTAPVGSFKANAFGLYDMAGNVWAWTEDCHHDGYTGAPADGSPWTSGDCSLRGLRGGSWNWNPVGLRSAKRLGLDAGRRAYDLGFRVGRTLHTP
jgi:formylglycine-generating enzyme required for sulfatase activity/class 3 adenylate cyclase